MELKEGSLYWIQLYWEAIDVKFTPVWQPGFWDGQFWRVIGNDHEYANNSTDIFKIGEEIINPYK